MMKRIILLLMLVCGFVIPMHIYAMDTEKEETDLEMGVDDNNEANSSEENRREYFNIYGVVCEKSGRYPFPYALTCCDELCCSCKPQPQKAHAACLLLLTYVVFEVSLYYLR